MKTYSVFVLRCQPFHNAHLQIIRKGLEETDEVIVVLGSFRTPRTIKNPWPFEVRRDFIESSLRDSETKRVHIIPLRDYLYSDTTWVTSLQNIVSSMTKSDDKIYLLGHFKDDSSYYLNYFPQWELQAQPAIFTSGKELIDGTEIRRRMYEGLDTWGGMVPGPVIGRLDDYMKTEEFKQLQREYNYIKDYKKAWSVAPFPPTFVTTDAIVVQAGHVLLIVRKTEPGKGCYAVPGGFLNQDETIEACTIRELKEETGIAVPAAALEKCIKDTKTFGHPKRSLRGRSLTHASLFVLDPNKALPSVKGDDDAAKALWMPINDISLHEENFFEDHLAMIQYFVNKL